VDAKCSLKNSIEQVIQTTWKVKNPLAGGNALPRFDEVAYSQVLNNTSTRLEEASSDDNSEPICAFTYLRMGQYLS